MGAFYQFAEGKLALIHHGRHHESGAAQIPPVLPCLLNMVLEIECWRPPLGALCNICSRVVRLHRVDVGKIGTALVLCASSLTTQPKKTM
eukprot:531293-Rhodomonas_salina.2